MTVEFDDDGTVLSIHGKRKRKLKEVLEPFGLQLRQQGPKGYAIFRGEERLSLSPFSLKNCKLWVLNNLPVKHW